MAGMATSFNVSSASSILSRPSQLSSLSFSSKPFFLAMRSSSRTPLRLGFPRIMAFSSNDIKVGSNIEVDGAPWRVIEFLHVKPGKGAAFVRTKMRNYVSGNTVEKTFRAGSTINEANIYKETKQFVYKDGPQFVFMDLTTYEETRVNESSIGDKTKWLKEGMDCNLLLWNDKLIDVDIPITVQLKVVDVDPGLKGDTAQGGGTKPATLETDAVVFVPLFVNVGDEILVDTRTGQYMTRAEKN
ncbi:hypothetical protein ACFX13_010252 [Malus domestica]|uniref:uncharacterized protein n=1 Tax=Malus domestica TaxID=3750 RepID=UPI000498E82E|nr:uncharacterized protein LOC103450751 [Malus domestica]XP_050116205.1 uncharacterized protein LOC126594048 [Malus sylvestris]